MQLKRLDVMKYIFFHNLHLSHPIFCFSYALKNQDNRNVEWNKRNQIMTPPHTIFLNDDNVCANPLRLKRLFILESYYRKRFSSLIHNLRYHNAPTSTRMRLVATTILGIYK